MVKAQAIAGGLKKAGSGIKSAAVKAAPVVGQVGRTAGATTAAAGAVAYEGTRRALNAIRDPGFFLFIAGILTFFFKEYLNNPALSITIAAIFMTYSAFFIFRGKGLIITGIFLFWYLIVGINNIEQIKYYIGPILISGMILHGIYKKVSKEGSFGQGFTGEISGFVPIFVFFLDVGLVEWLTQTFNLALPSYIITMLVYIPFWGLLGLFTTKKENIFITIAKIGGLIYIFVILLVSVPGIYGSSQGIPGAEEFIEARQQVQDQFPKTENPVISQISCSWEAATSPGTSIEECVKHRQDKAEAEWRCEQQDYVEATPEFDTCVEDEIKKLGVGLASGTINPLMKKPTKAEFQAKEFPREVYQSVPSLQANLVMENPRKRRIDVALSCSFKKGSETIPGEITDSFFSTEDEETGRTIICEPTQELEDKATYTVTFEAALSNLETTSYLDRLFIGEKRTTDEMEELHRIYFGANEHLSWSAQEFARINLALGQPTTNPLINSDDPLILTLSLENLGFGKITQVDEYTTDFHEYGITTDSECRHKENIPLPETKLKKIQLTVCKNIELPYELADPLKEEPVRFAAILKYSYQIKKEFKTTVKLI